MNDRFDLEAATLSDVDGALERLDAADLRRFLMKAVSLRPSSVSLYSTMPAPRGLAHELVEFAARKLGGARWLLDDPDLLVDIDRWCRSTMRTLRVDFDESSALFVRARRLLLRNEAPAARACYETVLSLLAELEAATDPDGSPQSGARVEDLVTPAVFGSYLVSVYEEVRAEERVEAVLDAVARLSDLGSVLFPLRLLEELAIRPLEAFSEFAQAWARALEEHAHREEGRPQIFAWKPSEALLAEALEHIEGLEGVARMARRTRDWAHYRTFVLRLADQSQWSAGLDVVEEADASLEDASGRALLLDIGVQLATRIADDHRAVELAKRAFAADPTVPRLSRWLLFDEPEREVLVGRLDSAASMFELLTPRMRALIGAMAGSFADVAHLLDQSDEQWEHDHNAGPIAFPALLVALYGGPKGTPVASKLCAPLFGARSRHGDVIGAAFALSSSQPDELQASEPPSSDWGWNALSPGPAIVLAVREREGSTDHAADLEIVPEVLRAAAARRASLALAHRDKAMYPSVATLVVAAAEATFRAGDPQVARSYLADLAQVAGRQNAFRGALTRTLAKSALVNEL
ncbi:MAG: hypothetical protein HOW73_45265 [Polyangiaceae bacterium]|nr:hypothetical protein [Polyangiaceae bacterium]